MARTIKEALNEQRDGFYLGHRLVFPFRCNLIKIIIDSHIFTEMVGGKNIKIQQDSQNTSVYIRSIGKLDNYFGSYKLIKIVAAEWDADITDMGNHIKLTCTIDERHKVKIREANDDILFIE